MNHTLSKLLISIILAVIAAYLIGAWLANSTSLNTFQTHSIVAIIAILIHQLVNSYATKVTGFFKQLSIPTRSDRQTGEVKWFNGSKGFGFISYGNDSEIFVHFRSVQSGSRRLSPGKAVEFTIGEGKKGAEAVDVLVID